MLYVIEIPHEGKPNVWTAADRDEFINAMWSWGKSTGQDVPTVWSRTSPRELLAQWGCGSIEEAKEELAGLESASAESLMAARELGGIIALAEKHGLDQELTQLAKGGPYTAGPVDEFSRVRDYLAGTVAFLHILESEEVGRHWTMTRFGRGQEAKKPAAACNGRWRRGWKSLPLSCRPTSRL